MKRQLRFVVLATTLILSMSIFFPVKTVKGLVTTTALTVQSVSIDDNRIVGSLSPTTAGVALYDIASGTSTTFPPPPSGGSTTAPVISGNKIVLASSTGLLAPMTLDYCVLPQVAVATGCPAVGAGSWTAIVMGLPNISFLAANGYPIFSRDLVAWPISGGFSYFRFSSGTTSTVLIAQPTGVSTDGVVISFVSGGTLWYVDTTSCVGPCTPTNVNTGLPAVANFGSTSVFDNIIAFMEPTAPTLIRYYDIDTGVASTAGAGPAGTLGEFSPAVKHDRIVFAVAETDLGFDCGGAPGLQSSERCLRYWNINSAPWVTPLLSPDAAPPIMASDASIYGGIIAFMSPTGALQYVRVPMEGDVNLDGRVDISDIATSAFCWQQVLKGTVC